jgi:hypothetical protein
MAQVLQARNMGSADEVQQGLLQNVYARVSRFFVQDALFKRDNPHANMADYGRCKIMNDDSLGQLAEVRVTGVTTLTSVNAFVDRLRALHPKADARLRGPSGERGGSSELVVSVPLSAGAAPHPARDAVSSFERFFTEPSVVTQLVASLAVLVALFLASLIFLRGPAPAWGSFVSFVNSSAQSWNGWVASGGARRWGPVPGGK